MPDHSSLHPAPQCLTIEDLRCYISGTMNDQQAGQLEQHLAECSRCEELLGSLEEPSDAFIQALSTLPVSPDDEADYRRLREQSLESPVEIANPAMAKDLFRQKLRLSDPVEASLPFSLGNYELLERIGRGATGAVFRARHSLLNQVVAVKVLNPACANAADAFAKEIETIGSLTHQHLVRATDAGQANGLHYLVMEFVQGVDAGRLLHHHETLPVADACELVRQAAIGLQFLHDRSLIHRDIKPSNLLVTASGQIKLLDLGIATHSTDQRSEEVAKPPQGTLAYMAPEQIAMAGQSDKRSDVYSLGCTLFKLLVGKTPTQPVTSITDLRPDVPKPIERLLLRMLAPEPDNRPQSANEVIETLGQSTRGADLPLLVSPLCTANCSASTFPNQIEAPPSGQLKPKVFSRRFALAALATATASAAIAMPRLRSAGPTLQPMRWRPLQPAKPRVLLSLGSPEKTVCDVVSDDRIQIISEDMALVNLGRPVVGAFKLRVGLLPREVESCGVFFQGHVQRQGDGSTFHFQTIELKPGKPKPESGGTSRYPDRLTWNLWTVNGAVKEGAAPYTPLAEIAVKIRQDTPAQQLVLTFGRQGMPETTFNGDKLHESMWQFSREARNHLRVSPTQLPTEYLGHLGLFSSKGQHTFEKPRLAYLEDTNGA